MTSESHNLTAELAEYVQSVAYGSLPQKVLLRAKEAIVDGLAVMLGGYPTDSAALVRRYIAGLEPRGRCTIVGDAATLPAEYAALANGVSGHALDFDDTQISAAPDRVYGLLTHPTTPVLAAALPVAEETGATGQELLAAFCAGVEVACKMAEAINPHHYKNGFHSTGTLGIFGAAAAAARLYRLSTEATRHALGIAASQSAGIRAAFGTMTKPYHAGAAAKGGVVAAKLAGIGYKTDPNALDGPWGYFQVAGGGVAPELIHGKLGNPYTFDSPGVSIKPYPCGSLSHPAMDALLDLVLQHDLKPEAVASVRLGTTSNVLAALRYREPTNELEAKFSIPFCLAILLLERKAGIAQFSDEVVRRADVRQMMAKVTPYLDPGLEALGFQRIRSLVQVTLRDGTVLSEEASTSRGTPERPMSRAELSAKFHDCAHWLLSPQKERRVLELLYGLEALEEVKTLTALLKG